MVSILIEVDRARRPALRSWWRHWIFVSADGLILTNKHVVSDDVASYVVVTSDGVEHDATVLAKDLFLDLAVVKIDGSDYQAVSLGDLVARRSVKRLSPLATLWPNLKLRHQRDHLRIDRTITAGSWMSGDEEAH